MKALINLINKLIIELNGFKCNLLSNEYAKLGEFVYNNRDKFKLNPDETNLNHIYTQIKQDIRYFKGNSQ